MDIKTLKERLENLSRRLDKSNSNLLNSRLKSLSSVYPFNEYEYVLMFLRDRNIIQFVEYEQLRIEYVSSNKYLDLYELAPRIFGEIWAHNHICDIDSRFEKPSNNIAPNYDGEYDLRADKIKVEVKASRAINTKKRGALVSKGLCFNSDEPFWMNFQQLKPKACDVFVFIGVWVDRIQYWVLSSKDVINNEFISHQHRGGIEYQIGITDKNIDKFDKYRVDPNNLFASVINKKRKRR